ncbi:DoxX family protein [Pseudonocardia oroxyli]|uniref:DoxX family protein n=1 Tax=Pseudonocardia oroxyli TaxID=366584 RepID=UPI000B87181B|nr:DoxX family protein [Pseudonocardia oroxyli]
MESGEPRRRAGGLAALVLRAAVGGTILAHGVRHARSLDGTAGWFGSIGFRQPRLQAKASAAVEIGAGAALVAGAATPLAAASVVATMTVAVRSVHAPNGFFITAEGWEYVTNLAAASIALAALGPGDLSIDRAVGLGRRLRGPMAAVVVGGLGVAAGLAHLAVFWREPAKSAVAHSLPTIGLT